MELTIFDEASDELSAAAFGWLTEGVAQSDTASLLDELQSGPRIADSGFARLAGSLPRRRTAGSWGVVSIAPQGTFEVRYNPYNERVIPWLKACIDERPESAEVQVGLFADDREINEPSIRLSVSFDDDLPDYVKLVFHVEEHGLTDPSILQDVHQGLLSAVEWACHRFNVVFGHFSYAHAGGRTELERYIRGPARVPERNTPNWRDRLRGYSWVTVVSADVAQRLGGSDALRETAAFYFVSDLPNGAVLLQATRWYGEYRGERVEAVNRVLREVLIEGELRRPAPVPGRAPTHMVLFDT
ncbi:DUF3396 domain-containing protein [Streptomyces sp. NBC_00715]|uniref:type VI immunity family protein n=1 Tax=Streptomyces sp. NBC_00715 TaxID=2975811 RepID=UPI003866FACB